MFNFLLNMVDLVKGKERADGVANKWVRDHAEEYDAFVADIDKMADGDMTAAISMYMMMKECLSPEAGKYYDIILRLFCGEQNAFKEITKLKHANEIGECAINGKTLQINIANGEISISEKAIKGHLAVNVSEMLKLWDRMPLYNKAYCKEQYDRVVLSLPKAMQAGMRDVLLNIIKIHYVANLVFMPEMMANLYDKAINENNGLLYAMYYFVTSDHGLQRMARIFSQLVCNEVPDVDGVSLFKSTIHNITSTSIGNGWESKESWKDVAESTDNDEAWKEIMHAVRYSNAKHGKPVQQKAIGDILKCKDKANAKKLIIQFLNENQGMFAPAYLLWSLGRSGCIKNVPYMVFHRALVLLLDKEIDYKKPQERYGLLKNHANERSKHKRTWNEVERIEEKWLPLFRSM